MHEEIILNHLGVPAGPWQVYNRHVPKEVEAEVMSSEVQEAGGYQKPDEAWNRISVQPAEQAQLCLWCDP